MTYLRELPWLSPHDLLPSTEFPRPASPAAWARIHDLFGFSAESCTAHFQIRARGKVRRTVLISGVRPTAGITLTNTVALALMRAIALSGTAPPPPLTLSKTLPTRRRPLAIVDASGEHRFWFSSGRVFYENRVELQEDDEVEVPVDYPVKEMTITLKSRAKGAAISAQPRVRPETVPWEQAEPRLATLMHPLATRPVAKGTAVAWTIRSPLVGFVYGLQSVQPLPERRRWTLAATLRRARVEAGLSLRDVAARARVCHASVAYAEAGRDPRLGTLAGYMHAIPSLAPQELLPALCESGSLSDTETWDLYRDLFGYEVRGTHKVLTVRDDGSSETVIDTIGLRSVRGDQTDLRIRTGLCRTIAQTTASVLREIEEELEELRVRLIRKTVGPVVHEFMVPARTASRGLSYRRTYSGSTYPLTRAQSRRSKADDGAVYSGVALPVFHPTHRAQLSVRLPGDFEPRWVRTFLWPACIFPDVDLPALSPHLVAPPARVSSADGATIISVNLDRPILGTSLTLTWGVPE